MRANCSPPRLRSAIIFLHSTLLRISLLYYHSDVLLIGKDSVPIDSINIRRGWSARLRIQQTLMFQSFYLFPSMAAHYIYVANIS